MAKVKLQGFRELERTLAELPKATAKRVLRRIASDALEPMADAAAAAAPHESGHLAFSISVSEKRTRRAKRASRGSASKNGVEVAMGPGAGQGVLEYATFVEFGTVDTAAQPFMRPAWDSGAEGALEFVKENLGSAIGTAVGKRRKKLAKLRG